MPPAPSPTSTPHVNQNCHNWLTKVVATRPVQSIVSEVSMTRRGPTLSRNQPATGATAP